MMTVKPLTRNTISDAEAVIKDRFPGESLNVFKSVMTNPLLAECEEAGDIVYEDGEPICFRAAILRNMYLGQKKIRGRVRGFTCIKKGASAEAIIEVQQAARKNKRGCSIAFSNSQCRETEKMARIMRAKLGPESCTRFLCRFVRPLQCLLYLIRRRVFKLSIPNWPIFDSLGIEYKKSCKNSISVMRVMNDVTFFNKLDESIRTANKGVICARTHTDVNWLFGGRIDSGRIVVLGAFREGNPIGYVAIDGGDNGKRWMVVDWVAVNNDENTLDVLLECAVEFVRYYTPCILLECIGFEQRIQHLLKKYFRGTRKFGCNIFSYNVVDKQLQSEFDCAFKGECSWFFGPYDGDSSM